MRFLVVDDEEDIRDIVCSSLSMEFEGCEIIQAYNGENAIEILKSNNQFDLMVTDYNMPKMNGAQLISQIKIQNLLPSCPISLCTAYVANELENLQPSELFHIINKPDISAGIKIMATKLKTLKGQTAQIPSVGENQETFIAISLGTLVKLGSLPSDLFIKLGDQKYVKNFNQGDIFTETDKKNILAKNIQKLYVQFAQAKNVTEHLEKHLNFFSEKADLTEKETLTYNTMVLESIKIYDFSPLVQEQAKKWSVTATKTIQKIPDLKVYLDKVLSQDGFYYSSHTTLVGLFATDMCFALDWKTEATISKLMMASLLHDILLSEDTDHENLSEMSKLTEKEKKKFKEHPIACAQLVQKFKEIPPDVDRLIMEHHEDVGGKGFPKGLQASNIGPLSCIFILAHKFTDMIWPNRNEGKQLTRKELSEKLGDQYKVGNFKKIIETYSKI